MLGWSCSPKTESPASPYAMNTLTQILKRRQAIVDANLHREHILPSEKAFAYKMKVEAMSRHGKRSDLTSDQVGPKLTAEEIGQGDSASQVKRYIRLTNLIPEILQIADDGKIALTSAVELSHITNDEQKNLYAATDYDGVTPLLSQAHRLS